MKFQNMILKFHGVLLGLALSHLNLSSMSQFHPSMMNFNINAMLGIKC